MAAVAVLAILSPLRLADGGSDRVEGSRRPTAAGPAVADRVAAAAAVERERVENTKLLVAALDECGGSLARAERRRIAATIVGAAARHGFDPLFIQALVEVESTCSPKARSRAGALGLIQVQPATARAVAARNGIPFDGPQALMRPEVNVEVGLRYLVELEEKFADPYLAVAAYNLGPARVAAMNPAHARRSRYVRRVLDRYESLLRDFAEPLTARS